MSVDPILGCPFCGGDVLKLVAERPGYQDLYALKCVSCMTVGPLSISQEFAFLNWQKRVAPGVKKVIKNE